MPSVLVDKTLSHLVEDENRIPAYLKNADKSNEGVKAVFAVTDTLSNGTLNQKELMGPNPTVNV